MLSTILCLGLVAERGIEPRPPDNLSVFPFLFFKDCVTARAECTAYLFFLNTENLLYLIFWYLIWAYLNLMKGDEMAFLGELS